MDRRRFMTASVTATAAAGLGAVSGAGAAEAGKEAAGKAGPGLRTKIAVSPAWFDGSHEEQIEQIAAHGFPAFETLRCGSWKDKEQVRARCKDLGVACGAVGGGMGTISAWGPNDPEHHARFVAAVKTGIAQAQAIGSQRVLALTGAALKNAGKEQQMDALVRAGRLVAPMVEDAGLVLVWECLNVLVNHPGYFLVYSAAGAELVRRTERPSIKFLFDIYHQQISEGNLIRNIQAYKNEIGHFHFADNPGRHEPGTGEINYQNVFKAIYESGYRDIVACEFGKTKSTGEILNILAECDRW